MAQEEATHKLFKSFIKNYGAYMWTALPGSLPPVLDTLKEWFDRNSPTPDKRDFGGWIQSLVDQGEMSQEVGDMLKKLENEPFPANMFFALIIQLQTYQTALKSVLDIYGLRRQYADLAKVTPNPAPVDNLVRSMIIDPGRTTENRRELKKYGFSDRQIDNIILSYYRTVDEGTIRVAYLRGIITEETMYERMRELGYTDTRIKEIVGTWELLPGPQDLFTMVAHEAFEPEMYKKMGLESEFPTEQVEWLKKQGISEEWARKYWISHWQQPSIGQGYEMLHRGVIDLEELDMLYRTVEIPPYWRDKLTAIAYSPYTRVDVRRMHELGVIDDEELIRSYMDLGYDREKAVKMAEFTIKYNSSHEKDLTRSTILSSYEKKLISRRDAKDLLMAQDYSDEVAEYYLTLSDYNADMEVYDLMMENIRETYLMNAITETEARDALNKMGLRGEKTDALIDSWNIQKYKYERLPSLTDLERFLLQGIITEDQFRSVMKQHGYAPAHIEWYLRDLRSPEASSPRIPSRTDLANFLKKKIITEEQWREGMKKLRYDDMYIDWYRKLI